MPRLIIKAPVYSVGEKKSKILFFFDHRSLTRNTTVINMTIKRKI